MTTQLFEFKKGNKILAISCGYYFKGKLLSRYKSEAIAILRKRIEDGGNRIGDLSRDTWEKGKEACPDEWQVIHEEYEKSKTKTNRTREKKQPYFDKIHERVIARKIKTLTLKIEDVKTRKLSYCIDCDERIKEIQTEIQQLNQRIGENHNSDVD